MSKSKQTLQNELREGDLCALRINGILADVLPYWEGLEGEEVKPASRFDVIRLMLQTDDEQESVRYENYLPYLREKAKKCAS